MEETRKPLKIKIGDTLTPIGMTLIQSENPVDLAGKTLKFVAYDSVSGTAVVTETASNVTAHPTFTFTADTTENRLKCNGHVAREGDQVVVSSTVTLPTGLAASTRYFVRDVEKNSFRVAEYETGDVVDITAAGSGTHSFYVVGHVQYDWQTADVASKRQMRAFFKVFDGSESQTFPSDEDGYPVWVS